MHELSGYRRNLHVRPVGTWPQGLVFPGMAWVEEGGVGFCGLNIVALTLRTGFGGPLYYKHNKGPPK